MTMMATTLMMMMMMMTTPTTPTTKTTTTTMMMVMIDRCLRCVRVCEIGFFSASVCDNNQSKRTNKQSNKCAQTEQSDGTAMTAPKIVERDRAEWPPPRFLDSWLTQVYITFLLFSISRSKYLHCFFSGCYI